MVIQESVRITSTVGALNKLDVLVADIGNAYLIADCHEIVYTNAGPAFVSNINFKKVIITQALYTLKAQMLHEEHIWLQQWRTWTPNHF